MAQGFSELRASNSSSPIRLLPHHFTKTTYMKVTEDLYTVQSHSQFLVCILFACQSTAFDRVDDSPFPVLSLLGSQDTTLLVFLLAHWSLLNLLCWFLLFSPDYFMLRWYRAQSLLIFSFLPTLILLVISSIVVALNPFPNLLFTLTLRVIYPHANVSPWMSYRYLKPDISKVWTEL